MEEMLVMDLDRGDFLRLGAGGLIAAAATGLGAPAAGAQLPPPTPKDDDVAFLSFATVAERTSRDFYRAAFKQAGTGLSAAQRRHINRVASAKRAHVIRLNAALGGDAPQSSDFVTVLPKGAVKTAARIAALGEQLETLLVRVYLNGVGFAEDPATRLFLGRLLAYDAEQLAWLRGVSGHASPAGLLSPIDLEPASDALDAFLSTPDFPD
jgi:ribosomal protein S12 methylthiotransferase accessory factor YcaO